MAISVPDAGVTLPPGAPGLGSVIAEKYRLDGILGIGGMGVVYRSNHALLGVAVAVKIILPEYAARPEFVTRFTNEARAAARIQSDNIARVSDVGTTPDGISYLVMELLEGEDLGEIVAREGPQPTERCVDWLLEAIAGLCDAHAAGIIHRDLKPSNLFLVRRKGKADRIKICDFGISKVSFEDGSAALTKTNTMLGSPSYMAPEQLRSSRTVDARADIWSLGIILYELLTGSTPFVGENVGAVFAAILENDPLPVRQILPTMPTDLDQAILRCLRRSPAERFATAAELATALAPFASDGGQKFMRRLSAPPPSSNDFALQRTHASGTHPAYRPNASGDSGMRDSAPSLPNVTRVLPPTTPSPAAAVSAMEPKRSRTPAIATAIGALALCSIVTAALVRREPPANPVPPAAEAAAAPIPVAEPLEKPTPKASIAPAPEPISPSAPPLVVRPAPRPRPSVVASVPAIAPAPAPALAPPPTSSSSTIYTDPWKTN